PKQGFEKFAELGSIRSCKSLLRKLEAGVPIRWRTKFLIGFPVCAKAVIRYALLRILEHLIGFAQFLEAGFRLRILADIRMIFARQFPVSALDVILRGIAGAAHDFVVILEFHFDYSGKRPLWD